MFTFILYWFQDDSSRVSEAKEPNPVPEDQFGRLTEDVSFSWSLNEDDHEVLDMLFPVQELKQHEKLWKLL